MVATKTAGDGATSGEKHLVLVATNMIGNSCKIPFKKYPLTKAETLAWTAVTDLTALPSVHPPPSHFPPVMDGDQRFLGSPLSSPAQLVVRLQGAIRWLSAFSV